MKLDVLTRADTAAATGDAKLHAAWEAAAQVGLLHTPPHGKQKQGLGQCQQVPQQSQASSYGTACHVLNADHTLHCS